MTAVSDSNSRIISHRFLEQIFSVFIVLFSSLCSDFHKIKNERATVQIFDNGRLDECRSISVCRDLSKRNISSLLRACEYTMMFQETRQYCSKNKRANIGVFDKTVRRYQHLLRFLSGRSVRPLIFPRHWNSSNFTTPERESARVTVCVCVCV